MNRTLATSAVSGPLSPGAKLVLIAEILADYVRARWLLGRRTLPATLTALRAGGPSRSLSGPAAQLTGVRLGRAVTRTLSTLPTDSRCLVRSLVLTSLLARRGMNSSVVIGVHSEDELRAHAWVEHEGRPLLPTGRTATGDAAYERLVEV